ncbi:GCN5-related N-acetyltransferase [Gemmatirosa kalamazoonensis]|uniref:GCN5-related N-acetyltransferase n=1 Tax=Gemmatirosa kalamazoonensis TaxID=861299 RepID=W0RE10_9BACT|nr:GNAT family N-acetyltransferase [Gemmatirosa kalamazoonensis]AHG89046.1 GCN5-related N-acetyltransferase [Gemmatirosa kalamazoonensis]
MSAPRFRVAEPADAEQLIGLMVRTFRETYSSDHFGICRPADVEEYIAEYFGPEVQQAELADPAMRTILADCDGELAGYGQLRLGSASPAAPGPRPCEVARFYVDRPWQGRGLAAQLMRECIRAAGDADPLWLGVYEHNRRARAFYAKCGFVPVGRSTFRMGGDVQDDCILALQPNRP